MPTYVNPFTNERFLTYEACIDDIQDTNKNELKALGVTAKQAYFNHMNRKKYSLDNKYGKSVLSGKPTKWNEKAGRYERFADEKERSAYREIFRQRMIKVHGADTLLTDPNHQRNMLANRSISGTYTFKDGTKKTYTGKDELALLMYLDTVIEWPGYDVHSPAPQNFEYIDSNTGKKRFYIPDVYIESLNLIIEVKGEQHNGWRNRDMEMERTKDQVLHTSGYNYVKVEDKNYEDLVLKLQQLKSKDIATVNEIDN